VLFELRHRLYVILSQRASACSDVGIVHVGAHPPPRALRGRRLIEPFQALSNGAAEEHRCRGVPLLKPALRHDDARGAVDVLEQQAWPSANVCADEVVEEVRQLCCYPFRCRQDEHHVEGILEVKHELPVTKLIREFAGHGRFLRSC
jgi:hypothetical protein